MSQTSLRFFLLKECILPNYQFVHITDAESDLNLFFLILQNKNLWKKNPNRKYVMHYKNEYYKSKRNVIMG
jgi:hypothetical protein